MNWRHGGLKNLVEFKDELVASTEGDEKTTGRT
jgi:hypothetical protein